MYGRLCYTIYDFYDSNVGSYFYYVDDSINDSDIMEFRLGYPKSTDKGKILKGIIKRIVVIDGQDTDLKCKGKVFDIEFSLVK